jgi:predicted aspartyl protease
MTKTLIIALIFFALSNITGFGQEEKDKIKMKTNSNSADSVEYELIVIDPGFESWYLIKQKEQYSQNYFRLKNIQYVTEWNNLYMTSGKFSELLTDRIDYDPFIEYPRELDSKLYWYFIYFEETNNLKLLPYNR